MTLPTILIASAQGNDQAAGGSGWFSLVFFGAIFAAMYFLLLRPQRKRLKETQALQAAIVEGDKVLLNSGISGFVSGCDENDETIVWLDNADGHGSERIEVRVTRGAIGKKLTPPAGS
ncbi:MAG: preprotein translocase subunit YajC [Actinomycetota bacterium]